MLEVGDILKVQNKINKKMIIVLLVILIFFILY